MKDYNKEKTIIFRCQKWCMLAWILMIIILFIFAKMYKDSWETIDDLDIYTFLMGIMWLLCSFLTMLRSYANKKSYIELTTTNLIMTRLANYPFPSDIEKIYIPYEEIKKVKIIPQRRWSYSIILTKKEEFWRSEKITFAMLKDWRKFDEELKKRWIDSKIAIR